MISNIKLFYEAKNFWKIWGVVVLCLVVVIFLLKSRLEYFKKENQKNLSMLKQVLPDLSEQSKSRINQQISDLKTDTLRLVEVFNPKEKWLKKDYDLSILFVEELAKGNQMLKDKSKDKNTEFTDLGFSDKLPSAQDAGFLLSQLYGLKEVVNSAIDLGFNFKSIKPQEIEKVEGIKEIELARDNLEIVCPKENFMEFMIQLYDMVPKPCIDSFLIQSDGDNFKINLVYSNVLLNLNQESFKDIDKDKLALLPEEETLFKQSRDSIAVLRSKNPFYVTKPKKDANVSEPIQPEQKKEPPPRFSYRGKAVLKNKEVVVLEDTLNSETIFLAPQERYGNFRLKSFSDDEVVLENLDNGSITKIKNTEK